MTPGERARKMLPNQPGVSYSSVFHAGIRVEKYVNASIRRAVLAERKACANSAGEAAFAIRGQRQDRVWLVNIVLKNAQARDARRKKR